MAKTHPHDALFKAAFTEVEHAAAHIRAILPPEVSALIDFATLAVVPGSFVDAALRFRHTDVLYRAAIRGSEALLYVVHEHQSRVEALMGLRLLRYKLRVWDDWLAKHPRATRVPPIIAVVVYHGKTGWYAVTAFEDLLDLDELDEDARAALAPYVPHFRFILDDLTAASDASLRSRAMSAFGRLVLWALKHAREPGHVLGALEPWAAVIAELLRTPNGQAAFEKLLRYIHEVNPKVTPGELQGLLAKAVGPDAQEAAVNALEKVIEQGREQGARELLMKMLTTRFGALPGDATARIQAASAHEIEAWGTRMVSAASLADVFGEPRRTKTRSRR
jgi:Putative transposase, YhgA-like/Domain of unknown function (DUF4351)